jgi:P4 family phage/plasmid primase-like protien
MPFESFDLYIPTQADVDAYESGREVGRPVEIPRTCVEVPKLFPPVKVEAKMNGANQIHDMYDTLGFKLVSGYMGSYTDDNGKIQKRFNFDKQPGEEKASWKNPEKRVYNKAQSGFAVITGKESGVTVIDIDDFEAPESQELMDLMTDCNMVVKTRRGFHYYYKYNPQIKTVSGDEKKKLGIKVPIDTRGDGGLIYAPPTSYRTPDGTTHKYELIKNPLDFDDGLLEIPQEVLDMLRKIGTHYFVGEKKEKEVKVVEAVVIAPKAEPAPAAEENILYQLADLITNNKSYDDWLNNGMICYNSGLPWTVWAKMSRKIPEYANTPDSVYTNKWESFKNYPGKPLTQDTWWKWLKNNNKEAWGELVLKRDDFYIRCENINHRDFAQFFYNMFPAGYVWNETLNWYALQPSNIWKHYDKGTPFGLKNHIASVLQEQTVETRNALLEKHNRALARLSVEDKDAEKKIRNKMAADLDLMRNVYKQFGNTTFINGIIDFLPSFYEKTDLPDLMDMNRGVFAFTDCVVPIKKGQVSPRPIAPTDWISRTCGYKFPKSNAGVRSAIKTFLNNLFPDAETPVFVMRVFGSCLLGKNRFERFYVLTGTGGNGKGVLMTLVHNTFGDYCMGADTSLITKPQERRDQPCPALVDARDRLLLSFTEPEREDKIQVGIIKKMTGGEDKVEARALKSNTIVSYIPKFVPIIQANNIPKLSKLDGGAKRRLCVIDFPFSFVGTPDPQDTKQKQGDPDVKDKKCKSDEWRDEFSLMLLEAAGEVAEMKSLPSPKTVSEATDDYIDDNNSIKEWLFGNYTFTKNSEDKITGAELIKAYEDDTGRKIDPNSFSDLLKVNNINKQKSNGRMCYLGIKRKDTPAPKCEIIL